MRTRIEIAVGIVFLIMFLWTNMRIAQLENQLGFMFSAYNGCSAKVGERILQLQNTQLMLKRQHDRLLGLYHGN